MYQVAPAIGTVVYVCKPPPSPTPMTFPGLICRKWLKPVNIDSRNNKHTGRFALFTPGVINSRVVLDVLVLVLVRSTRCTL